MDVEHFAYLSAFWCHAFAHWYICTIANLSQPSLFWYLTICIVYSAVRYDRYVSHIWSWVTLEVQHDTHTHHSWNSWLVCKGIWNICLFEAKMDKNTKSVTSSSDCHVVHTVIIEVRISHDGMNYDQHKFFKKICLSNVPNNHNMWSIKSLEATPVLVHSNQVKRYLLCIHVSFVTIHMW